jgi:hypothetical protein
VPENADIDFYSKNLISNLQETFTLCEQAEQERLKGNDEKANNLYNQGLARLEATVESASPEPREDIVAGYNDAFDLLQRAEATRNYGEAEYLYNQGLARLEATVESASPEPREDIVAGYNEAFTLFQNAEEESAAGNGVEAVNLYHQGFARLRAMERLARPAPAASCSIS